MNTQLSARKTYFILQGLTPCRLTDFRLLMINSQELNLNSSAFVRGMIYPRENMRQRYSVI